MKRIKIFLFVVLDLAVLVLLRFLLIAPVWNNQMENYLFSDWPAERRATAFTEETAEKYYELVEKIGKGEEKFEMLFSALGGVTLIGYPQMQSKVQAPFDLHYYNDPADASPSYVISKGTDIFYEYNKESPYAETAMPYAYEAWGYGFYSFPTRQRGWRLAIPFSTGKAENDTFTPRYIRLEELEKLQVYRYQTDTGNVENGMHYHEFMQLSGERYSQSLEFTLTRDLLRFDKWLTGTSGLRVLSKDLFKPGLPLWAVLTLIGVYAAANLGIVVWLVRRKNTRKAV